MLTSFEDYLVCVECPHRDRPLPQALLHVFERIPEVLKRRLRTFVCVDLLLWQVWKESYNLRVIDMNRFRVPALDRCLLRWPCRASDKCNRDEQTDFGNMNSAQHG